MLSNSSEGIWVITCSLRPSITCTITLFSSLSKFIWRVLLFSIASTTLSQVSSALLLDAVAATLFSCKLGAVFLPEADVEVKNNLLFVSPIVPISKGHPFRYACPPWAEQEGQAQLSFLLNSSAEKVSAAATGLPA
jgi:hypothetical protein